MPSIVAAGVPRKLSRDWLIASSLANLCLVSVWPTLFAADSASSYFLKLSALDYAAVVLNLLLLTIAFVGAAGAVRRARSPWARASAMLGLGAVLFVPLNFLRSAVPGLHLARILGHPAGLPLLALAAAVLLVVLVRWREQAFRIALGGVLVLFPLVLINLGRLAWTVARTSPRSDFTDAVHAPDGRPEQESRNPRLLWIILDELDYRIAFVDRPDDVKLPQLDRLVRRGFSADRAYPPASDTKPSILSLLSGEVADSVLLTGPATARIRFSGADGFVPFGYAGTIVGDARAQGRTVGIVGWYHPYCRLFAAELSQCAWQSTTGGPRDSDTGLLSVMGDQLLRVLPSAPRRDRIDAFRWLLDRARTAAADSGLDLVYVHLTVPHSPPIYDRHTAEFTRSNYSFAGYLDNLVLADSALGEIRASLERSGLASSTVLVVSSDHFWRYASHLDGRMDHRVPFLVEFPTDTAPLRYGRPFNTVLTRRLFRSIISNSVVSATDLAQWLERNRTIVDTLGVYRITDLPATEK